MIESKVNFSIIGDLAYDQTITPLTSRRVLAGAVYNVAVAASTIANPNTVGVVARVGEDFQEGIDALSRRGVNVEGIAVIPNGKTAVFTITQHADNIRNLSANLGVADYVDTNIFPESHRLASYVHLASSHPDKYLAWLPYLRNILPKNTIISADANDLFIQNAINATILALEAVDLIFINEAELSAIQARYPDFVLNKPTVLKKGSRGAVYIDMAEGIEYSVEAPKVNAIDTSGAGDTLAGIFIARRVRGSDIKSALQDSVNMASKAVTDFGVEHINPLS